MIVRAAVLAALVLAGPAQGACRLALTLGLDVSGSVDAAEYRQQLDGLADALGRPAVREALLAMPDAPVALSVFEWSGPSVQRLLLDWRRLEGPQDIDATTGRLRAVGRRTAPPETGLGAAMAHGAALLARGPACWRRVLDLSGDGMANAGPRPEEVRDGAALSDVTVNVLVVGRRRAGRAGGAPDLDALEAYFRARVIRGPRAFVEPAEGYDGYADAMARKLLREIEVVAVGAAQ
ncbi:Protein of unknown function [Tranquillimonas rosea]|uniref:VWFA domain-containing protein n=1 Tax=Tranquillimonas rosea TaxID=641238 RepID=A0A1H9WC35_9RHOB|nr:DUF1194 domain-containing protein [Tranquillimonas rosea]SES31468.1 Protein of unknown function [Tranquillimonas rosea]